VYEHIRDSARCAADREALGMMWARFSALGETTRRVPTSKAVADAMDSFLSRLSAYTRGLGAEVDERDPASVQRFLGAVAPIQEHRTTWSADTADAPSEPEPQAPASGGDTKPVPQLAPQAGASAPVEVGH
jgi:hypothetical protein